jgi:hypothetical protein
MKWVGIGGGWQRIALIVFVFSLFMALFFLRREVSDNNQNISEEYENLEVEISDEPREERLIEIIESFLGRPYQAQPLGEKENQKIYRRDVFDCTTFVVTVATEFHARELEAEELIKLVHYYPAGQVSYENRLHFTTYRNKVSPYFQDVTRAMAPEDYLEKKIILNKIRLNGSRLININWEQEIIVPYVEIDKVDQLLPYLPRVIGVSFLIEGDQEIGLDVRHEGFLVDGKMIHASSFNKAVVVESLNDFIGRTNYSGINFFEITEAF